MMFDDPYALDSTSPDYAVKFADIQRRRKLAEALQSGGTDLTEGKMVSGHYVTPGWGGALSKLAQAYIGMKTQERLSGEERAASGEHRAAIQRWVGGMPEAREGTPDRPAMEELTPGGMGGGPDMPAQPAQAGMAPYTPSRTDMLQWAMSAPDQSGEGVKSLSAAALAAALKGKDTKYTAGTRINPQTNTLEHGVWDQADGQWKFTHGVPELPKSTEVSGFTGGRPHKYLMTADGKVVRDLGQGATGKELDMQTLAKTYGADPQTAGRVAFSMDTQPPVAGMPAFNRGAAAGLPMPGLQGPPGVAPPAAPKASDTYVSGGYALTEGGPYSGKKLGAGYPTDARGNDNLGKLSEDIQHYGKDLTAKNIPKVGTDLSRLEATFDKYKDGKIPGVGHLKNLPLSQIFNSEGQNVQNDVQQVFTAFLTMDAGKSQTAQEVQNELRKLGTSWMQNAQTARDALVKVRAGFNAVKKGIDDSYHKDVVRNYRGEVAAPNADAEAAAAAFLKKFDEENK